MPKLAPRDRRMSCAGRPAVSWSALSDAAIGPRSRRTGTGQPSGQSIERRPVHRATGTPSTHAPHTRPPTSTTNAEHHRREDAFLRLAFRSANAIATTASADLRALAPPHARDNRPVTTPLPRSLPLPAKGLKPPMPGLARQVYLPGGGRGSRASAEDPLPRKPRHRAKNCLQAGQRPVVLRENNS